MTQEIVLESLHSCLEALPKNKETYINSKGFLQFKPHTSRRKFLLGFLHTSLMAQDRGDSVSACKPACTGGRDVVQGRWEKGRI